MKTVTRLGACALALALGWVWAIAGAVPATADDIAWTVATADNANGSQRPNYTYAVAPGATISDAMVVTNAGSSKISLKVYAADGFTTSSGHLDVLPAGTASKDLGTWVTPAKTTVDLAPGQRVTIPFTIKVPADATPGDHTGGIVTSYVDTAKSSTVSVDRRLGSRIHIRVAGTLTPKVTVSNVSVQLPLAINPFAPVTATVRYRLTNTGNVRVVGHESVSVAGLGGLGGGQANAVTDEVIPGGTIERAVEIRGVWPLIHGEASVTVTPETVGGELSEASADASEAIWMIPWGWLGILVLLIAGGIVIGIVNHRRHWEWVDADDETAGQANAAQEPGAAQADSDEGPEPDASSGETTSKPE